MKFVTCTIQQGCTQKIDGWQEGRHLHMVDAEEYTFPQHIDRNGQGHMNNLHSPEYYRILRVQGHDVELPHVVDTDTGQILSCSSPQCLMHDPRPQIEMVEPPERMGVFKFEQSITDVFRQCDNTECPAFRHGKPHSHIEREMLPPTTIDNAVSRLERLRDFTANIPLKPWQALTLTETNDALNASPVEPWISIPLNGPHSADLMQQVGEYITWVETGLTAEVCKCERIPHPTKAGTYKGETALDCPAHAKEGLVLGFFTWLRGKNEQEPCGICSGRGCPDCDTVQMVRGEEIVSKAEHGD